MTAVAVLCGLVLLGLLIGFVPFLVLLALLTFGGIAVATLINSNLPVVLGALLVAAALLYVVNASRNGRRLR